MTRLCSSWKCPRKILVFTILLSIAGVKGHRSITLYYVTWLHGALFWLAVDRSDSDALRGIVQHGRATRLRRLLLPHGSAGKTHQRHGQTSKEAEPSQPKPLPLHAPGQSEGVSTQRPRLHLSRESHSLGLFFCEVASKPHQLQVFGLFFWRVIFYFHI